MTLYRARGRRRQWKLRKTVDRIIARNIETKSGVISGNEGVEILHNNFITRSTNILATRAGVFDAEAVKGYRVGDKINLSGVSIKMMLELNERYSDVTFRILVVKCAKGDSPTFANLWNGASPNKMIDTVDTERFSIVASKTLKMTAPNQGIIPATIQTVGGGFAVGTDVISRATRIVKFWIPGNKFGRNGQITYENNGSEQVKFFDYQLLVYAYSNYSTAEVGGLPPTSFFVGRVNDEVIKMFYKDA